MYSSCVLSSLARASWILISAEGGREAQRLTGKDKQGPLSLPLCSSGFRCRDLKRSRSGNAFATNRNDSNFHQINTRVWDIEGKRAPGSGLYRLNRKIRALPVYVADQPIDQSTDPLVCSVRLCTALPCREQKYASEAKDDGGKKE